MALVLTRLVRSNYDELDNIPIIHQDLTASFTKQADTYYIHTGSTTSAYIKGRMYYCDGTNLKKVVIVDEVNDGKLTITVNGTAHTFTANQSGNTSFSITDTHYTNYLQIKGNGTEAVKFTQNADKTLNFKPGANISISAASGEITISATDTNTHNSHAIISGTKSDNSTQIKGSASSGDIILGDSGASAGSYGNASNQEPGYGTTFNVPYITVNAKGIVTAISNKTVKIPASDNTNTATAADNILDGSNNGTEITYAPYTSQQLKLSFDTSITLPTRTDRLNLNGYLYATKLYSDGKEVLTRTTYEWNKEFSADSNGAISLGRYNVYNSQLTFDISSTTSTSINGKLVIATQNGQILQAKVFGDATGALVSKIIIYQSRITNHKSWIEVFCNFDGLSKNKVHIYGVALNSTTVTHQMSSVTITNGVPSPITNGDYKWDYTIVNDLSIKTLNTNNTTAQTTANENIIGSGTINLHKVAKTGSYDDLLNAPNFNYDSSTKILEISYS